MKQIRFCLALWFALFAGVAAGAKPETSPDAAATLIVYNEDDPASVNLAASYAARRGVPFTQMIGLSLPREETITRAQYDEKIAGPLRQTLVDRGWWKISRTGDETLKVDGSAIRYVALMRGVPLKIAPEGQPYKGNRSGELPGRLRHNNASVDSELARLGLAGRQISGPIDNPFRGSLTPLAENPIPGLLLVCRLDAATPNTVQRMIDDAVETEKSGLWGFAYIDSRNIRQGGYLLGDQWMRRIVRNMTHAGIPCIHEDTGHLFPNHYPMRHAAFYYGWYSGAVAGPFLDKGFRFERGGVGVHLYSFSAQTLREPGKSWCLSLLERGAAVTIGNVYEPYLQFTPDLSVFEERLRAGGTFAEAAYAAQPVLSWMTTFIGDPLYRPFKGNGRKPEARGAVPFAAYREGARLWFAKGPEAGAAALSAQGEKLRSGVIFEGLATLQATSKQPGAALRSLEKARGYYTDGEDRNRCALHAIGLLANGGERKAAITLTREQIAAHPETPSAAVLRRMLLRLDPPPKPAKSAKPAGKPAQSASGTPRKKSSQPPAAR